MNKNDYLGEYTGELISHKEADKRGKIYDRANSSFLFDLNDQVLFRLFSVKNLRVERTYFLLALAGAVVLVFE